MNKKGFTLVELLAVITILALLGLIAVPTVNSLIDRQKKKIFTQSVNGVIEVAKNSSQQKDFSKVVYKFNTNKLYKCDNNGENCSATAEITTEGSIKDGQGFIIVDDNGNTGIYVKNTKYCAYKHLNGSLITSEKLNDCNITISDLN